MWGKAASSGGKDPHSRGVVHQKKGNLSPPRVADDGAIEACRRENSREGKLASLATEIILFMTGGPKHVGPFYQQQKTAAFKPSRTEGQLCAKSSEGGLLRGMSTNGPRRARNYRLLPKVLGGGRRET